MSKEKPNPETVKTFVQELTRQGKIIEAGWLSFRYMVIPDNASDVQITETRRGFYAGATHLFQSLMAGLSDGSEVQPEDEERIAAIAGEIEGYLEELQAELKGR